MFIWANDGIFGDDEPAARDDDANTEGGDDAEDEEDEEIRDLSNSEGSEHPVFGRTWAYNPTPDAGSEMYDVAMAPEAKKLLDALSELTKGPEDLDRIREKTSENAIDAFRRVVMGIFGSVPGDTFEVIINTDKTGVTRLMQSALGTGYSLRNAEWRMELADALAHVQKLTPPGEVDTSNINSEDGKDGITSAHSVSTAEVHGEVQWWDAARDERRRMSAAEYVAKIEAENALLKERLEAAGEHRKETNRLLEYMRTLKPEKVAELQSNMGEHAVAAFKEVVRRILGTTPSDKMQITFSTSRDYIGQLAFWCLLVGYHVRALEKKYDMARLLHETEQSPEIEAATATTEKRSEQA